MGSLEDKEIMPDKLSVRLKNLNDEHKIRFHSEKNKSQLVKMLLEYYYNGQLAFLNLSDDILEKYNNDKAKEWLVDKLLIEHYSENIIYIDQIQKIKTLGITSINEHSMQEGSIVDKKILSEEININNTNNSFDNKDNDEIVEDDRYIGPVIKDTTEEVVGDYDEDEETLDEEVIKQFMDLKSIDTSKFEKEDFEKFNKLVRHIDLLIEGSNPLFYDEIDTLRSFIDIVYKKIKQAEHEKKINQSKTTKSIMDLTNLSLEEKGNKSNPYESDSGELSNLEDMSELFV